MALFELDHNEIQLICGYLKEKADLEQHMKFSYGNTIKTTPATDLISKLSDNQFFILTSEHRRILKERIDSLPREKGERVEQFAERLFNLHQKTMAEFSKDYRIISFSSALDQIKLAWIATAKWRLSSE